MGGLGAVKTLGGAAWAGRKAGDSRDVSGEGDFLQRRQAIANTKLFSAVCFSKG